MPPAAAIAAEIAAAAAGGSVRPSSVCAPAAGSANGCRALVRRQVQQLRRLAGGRQRRRWPPARCCGRLPPVQLPGRPGPLPPRRTAANRRQQAAAAAAGRREAGRGPVMLPARASPAAAGVPDAVVVPTGGCGSALPCDHGRAGADSCSLEFGPLMGCCPGRTAAAGRAAVASGKPVDPLGRTSGASAAAADFGCLSRRPAPLLRCWRRPTILCDAQRVLWNRPQRRHARQHSRASAVGLVQRAGSSTGASMLRQGGAHALLAASHRFCGSRWGVWACGKARARARSEVCLLAALPRGRGRHPARPSPWTPHPGSGRTNELSGIGRCSQTARAGKRQRAGADGSQRGAHLLPAPAVRGAAAGTPVRHAPLLHAQTAPKACLRAPGLTVVGMRCLPRFWAAGASICTRGRCRRPLDVATGASRPACWTAAPRA